jgi:hypothetical protein
MRGRGVDGRIRVEREVAQKHGAVTLRYHGLSNNGLGRHVLLNVEGADAAIGMQIELTELGACEHR